MSQRRILGEETVCPKCSDALRTDIDVGDGFLYDVCFGCGFKRKKKVNGRAEDQVQEGA